MSKLPQISHDRVIRALRRRGFWILREGKHVSMTDGRNLVIIPRHKVLKTGTLHHILKGADLAVEEFLSLL